MYPYALPTNSFLQHPPHTQYKACQCTLNAHPEATAGIYYAYCCGVGNGRRAPFDDVVDEGDDTSLDLRARPSSLTGSSIAEKLLPSLSRLLSKPFTWNALDSDEQSDSNLSPTASTQISICTLAGDDKILGSSSPTKFVPANLRHQLLLRGMAGPLWKGVQCPVYRHRGEIRFLVLILLIPHASLIGCRLRRLAAPCRYHRRRPSQAAEMLRKLLCPHVLQFCLRWTRKFILTPYRECKFCRP